MISIDMRVSGRTHDLTSDILAQMVDGIVAADAGGGIIIWNRAAEEMTGIPASEAIGMPAGSVFRDNHAVAAQIEKTLSTGRSYSDYDAELAAKNRGLIPVGLVTNLLTDHDGAAIGVLLTIRDQSGMRELKDRMRRSDRLAAIGMIAAGIAHEIKNPLVGIRGAAQLMQSEIRSGIKPLQDSGGNLMECVEVIFRETERLNTVLEDILDFTRVKPRDVSRINIHSILDRALLLQEESARKSSVDLSRQYDPSLPEVRGDEGRLVQVFLNIIKNAIEAMPNGGRLTIVTRMSDQFTSVQADGKKHRLMVVKVSDTGAGIKEGHLEDIFAPFFTTKDKGTGLGLALSYQIVQEHMGTIKVESREGDGATFSVYLPLAR